MLFWKTERSFLSDNMVSNDRIIKVNVWETLNSFFGDVTKNQGLKDNFDTCNYKQHKKQNI